MKVLLTFFTVILLSFNSLSFTQLINNSFKYDGITRSYFLFLAKDYNSASHMPVVLNLHCWGKNHVNQINYSQMNAVADTAGFIAVYPDAINGRWNSGISDNPDWPTTPDVNDVGFIDALIDTLFNSYSIDLERIYSCGFANGGFMSFKLACQLSDRIAAVASVSGIISESTANNCNTKHAMPVLLINGTANPFVPYSENGVSGWYSVEQTISHWTDFNNCTVSDTISLSDLDPSDGCIVEKITYTDCSDNVSVVSYKIINGGHYWPGGNIGYWVSDYGNINKDINASIEIWNFFKNYKL